MHAIIYVTMFVNVNASTDLRGHVKLAVEYPVIDEEYFTLASRWMGLLFILWRIISIAGFYDSNQCFQQFSKNGLHLC